MRLHRVCVDTASLLAPGEGLLVGSFARALFLVHSECAQSAYISSRPFRVNAGPVVFGWLLGGWTVLFVHPSCFCKHATAL